MMRFDRFTERAQDAAMRAYEVLQRYGHSQVDTEHMLLALIEQPEGVIPDLLRYLSVDLEQISHRLDEELKRTHRTQIYGGGVGQVYITPRLKRVMDQSNQEAAKLKDDYISTEHLFLALAAEREASGGPHPGRDGRHPRADPGGDQRGPGRAAGNHPPGREPLPHPGKVQPRSDAAGAPGQARSGHRARRRDPAGDPGAQPAHQEQPGADRRGRRGQDGHRRRPGDQDRPG